MTDDTAAKAAREVIEAVAARAMHLSREHRGATPPWHGTNDGDPTTRVCSYDELRAYRTARFFVAEDILDVIVDEHGYLDYDEVNELADAHYPESVDGSAARLRSIKAASEAAQAALRDGHHDEAQQALEQIRSEAEEGTDPVNDSASDDGGDTDE